VVHDIQQCHSKKVTSPFLLDKLSVLIKHEVEWLLDSQAEPALKLGNLPKAPGMEGTLRFKNRGPRLQIACTGYLESCSRAYTYC